MGDLPDYTRQVTIRYEGGFLGLEELAVRLGFPGVWNLKGNIVLMEDFESELTEWLDDSDGIGSTAARTSSHKYSGDWSVKLHTISTIGARAGLERYFHCSGVGKYAVFMRICLEEHYPRVGFFLELDTPTINAVVDVRFDYWTKTLSVLGYGGISHTVATDMDLNCEQLTWYPLMVTFDLAQKTYDKLYFSDREYDISDVALDYAEPGDPLWGYLKISTEQWAGTSFDVYVDDIIIAKNVP